MKKMMKFMPKRKPSRKICRNCKGLSAFDSRCNNRRSHLYAVVVSDHDACPHFRDKDQN